MWASDIDAFNTGNTKHPFNTVIMYGGDMEYYPDLNPPFQTYPPNLAAIEKYRQVTGVTHIHAIVDGRMDGGEDYSPDLSKLSVSAVQQWADVTAAVYCSYDIDGISIDLEPYRAPYKANLLVFLARLGYNVLNAGLGCVNSKHPNGRYLSMFVFAEDATTELYNALGANGFVFISGYDLSNSPAGTPTAPSVYGKQLLQSITTTMKNAANNDSFAIAIPGAASTHEFEKYVPQNGSPVMGYPMYNSKNDSYLTAAFQAFQQSGVYNHPGYLGRSIWGFSSFMAYPPHSDNLFYPSTPFVNADEVQFLKNNL